MLLTLITGALCGALGQGVRALLGLKKELEANYVSTGSNFVTLDWPRLAITIAVGAAAGAVTALVTTSPIALVLAGYAGTDAIEGLAKKYLA